MPPATGSGPNVSVLGLRSHRCNQDEARPTQPQLASLRRPPRSTETQTAKSHLKPSHMHHHHHPASTPHRLPSHTRSSPTPAHRYQVGRRGADIKVDETCVNDFPLLRTSQLQCDTPPSPPPKHGGRGRLGGGFQDPNLKVATRAQQSRKTIQQSALSDVRLFFRL